MENNGEETPILIAQTGPLNQQRWKIRDTLLMGRDVACDIVIPDRQVSRRHAHLTITERGVFLEDLGSKNGTHHNGSRIRKSTLLQDGDVFQIALAQEFIFVSANATMPLDPGMQMSTEHPKNKLRLQKRSRQIWIGDTEVLPPLSVAQFRLLELLYEQDGRVVSRKNITIGIWGEEEAIEVSNQALDALIRRLRDRIAAIDPTHSYIVTVRGHGLRLDNPSLSK
ncbi:MAG: FHA domain-containing protein [Anaerolineales bacterium]